MKYTLEIREAEEGRWWARLETETHYAKGEGEDAWSAALSAVQEAQFLFPPQPQQTKRS